MLFGADGSRPASRSPGGSSWHLLAPDAEITRAHQAMWTHRKVAAEHGTAALTALLCEACKTEPDETVAVVLCGANTDLHTRPSADRTAVQRVHGPATQRPACIQL